MAGTWQHKQRNQAQMLRLALQKCSLSLEYNMTLADNAICV